MSGPERFHIKMAKVPPLTTQTRLVCIRTLLVDGQPRRETELLIKMLLTDTYTAVSEDILKVIIERLPHRVDNRMLLALCPPHIKNIYLRNCSSITSIGIESLLSKCRRLEKFDLSGVNQLMRPTFFQLCGCVGPQITSMNLEGNPGVSDECVHTLLLNLPNLVHLGLALCDNITDNVFVIDEQDLIQEHSNPGAVTGHRSYRLPNLSSMDIQGCRSLSSTAIRNLTRLCGPSLRKIDMSCTKIDCTALWFLSGYSLSLTVQLAVAIEEQLEAEETIATALVETAKQNSTFSTGEKSKNVHAMYSYNNSETLTSFSGNTQPLPLDDRATISDDVCGWLGANPEDPIETSQNLTENLPTCSKIRASNDSFPSQSFGACCAPICDSGFDYVEDITVGNTDPEEIHIEDLISIPDGNPFTFPIDISAREVNVMPSTSDDPGGLNSTAISTNAPKLDNEGEVLIPRTSLEEQLKDNTSDLDIISISSHESSKPDLVSKHLGMSRRYEPNLESIEMSFIQFYHEKFGRACLEALFLTNHSIKEFAASWMGLDDDMLDFIADHALDLTSLTLTDCDMLTTVGVANIAKKCKKLSKLHLQGVSFIGDAAILPVVSHVRSLNLAETNVTDVLLKHISEVSSDQLRELDLSWCEELTDIGLAAITSKCTQLRSLSLRQSCASSATVKMLAENCTQLEDINLSSLTSFTDDVLSLLAKNLCYLTKIDISWNMNITDTGVATLLKNSVHLKEAQLAGLKQLTESPFLPIITDITDENQCQLLQRLAQASEQGGENSLPEEFQNRDLTSLPHRSAVYAPSLALIDLTYCDSVHDGYLSEIVAVCRNTLLIRDYYGSLVHPEYICQRL